MENNTHLGGGGGIFGRIGLKCLEDDGGTCWGVAVEEFACFLSVILLINVGVVFLVLLIENGIPVSVP